MNTIKQEAFSIRVHLITLIIFMGILAMGLALGTGEVYSRLIMDNYRQALQRLVELRTLELQEKLITLNEDLGLSMQHGNNFRDAFAKRDKLALMDLLDDQFFQYLTTVGLVDLQQLVLFESDLQVFLISAQHAHLKQAKLCQALLTQAAQREGSDRLKPISDFCLYEQQAYLGVLVPIGGLRLQGYALVVSNPVNGFVSTEKSLGMPLRIRQMSGKEAYRSEHWPTIEAGQHVETSYLLHNQQQIDVLELTVANSAAGLEQQLNKTQWGVIAIVGAITSLVIIVWLLIAQKTMIGPLRKLHSRVHEIHQSRVLQSKPIEARGAREIRQLANTFNEMNYELGKLQSKLERLAYIDQLTELPNRILFYSHLHLIEKMCLNGQGSFALFMIDLNGFKKINDTLGHHVGDGLLNGVGSRFRDLLRQSDQVFSPLHVGDETIARLGGDEFVVIAMNAANAEAAHKIASNLRGTLQEEFHIEAHHIRVGMSIGVAFYPQHTDDCSTLMQYADIAMYEAKRTRQDLVVYCDDLEIPSSLSPDQSPR